MFEPPLFSQLLGTGVLVIGFLGVGILAHQREQQEIEERRLQKEYDTQVIRASNELIEMGRELERQEIRKNIRRSFKGFTYDSQPPVGLPSTIEDVPQVFRECIEDYDRLACDYQEETSNNELLRKQNAELLVENGRLLYQEMTMDFRQNPRKWRAKT